MTPRRPAPLPAPLARRTLTPHLLRHAGESPERLRRDDVVPLIRGLHLPVSTEGVTAAHDGGVSITYRRRAITLAQELPDVWLSDTTAALLHGWRLPPSLEGDVAVHVTQPAGTTRRIRRPGVIGHRRRVAQEDLIDLAGVTATSAARTWLDLADRLTETELIILGDQLVRHPYPRYEERSAPHVEPRQLVAVTERTLGVLGRRRAQRALARIRIGADSAQETRLRLALVDAGLPEPMLQVPADPRDPRSPRADMGFPQARLAIQYEGSTHFTPEQARKDQRRDNVFQAAGWRVVRVNLEDYRDGFRAVVAQIRALLASS